MCVRPRASLMEDDKFPTGLRVLVVDDDTTCLKLMDTLLKKCQYQGLYFFLLFYLLYRIPSLTFSIT